jgi:acyl-coenzyme A thioesterase PaaI-like protein
VEKIEDSAFPLSLHKYINITDERHNKTQLPSNMAFEAATAVRQKDSHTYTATFSGEWVIGSVPHGGYVTSIFQTVASQHFRTTLSSQNQPHLLALHLEFLRRTDVGPATFVVRDVKLGRQMSIIHVTLSQGAREEIVGYITHSNLSVEKGVSFDTHWLSRSDLGGVDTSSLENGTNNVWLEKQPWPMAEFRKAANHFRTWMPRRGQTVQSGYDFWSCPAEAGARWKNDSLGYLVDCFPQLLESYLQEGVDPYSLKMDVDPEMRVRSKELSKKAGNFWYPTVLLNIDVKKALPEEGERFLFTRVRAKQIRNGRYDLEVVIVDPSGDLVALSHHVCLVVGAERNMAKRREVGANESGKL